jgi:hypothetical protein
MPTVTSWWITAGSSTEAPCRSGLEGLARRSFSVMADYLLGDIPVASAAPLTLLPMPIGRAAAPELTVTQRLRAAKPRPVGAWRHRWHDDTGHAVIELSSRRDGYLLRFPSECDFVISGDAKHIDVRPHRRLSPQAVEHLLADQVLPRCLAQSGELVVHAACIAFGRKIALFVGESGCGKSTLAGLFLRAGRTVMTDDCAILRPTPEAVHAVPTYPSLRLNPDSANAIFPANASAAMLPPYSEKQRIPLPDTSGEAAAGQVTAIYFLGDAHAALTNFCVEPLGPAASCIQLMEQSFQLDVLDRDAVGRLLGRAGEIVSRLRCYRLDFRRDFRQVDELVASIERHFAEAASLTSAA